MGSLYCKRCLLLDSLFASSKKEVASNFAFDTTSLFSVNFSDYLYSAQFVFDISPDFKNSVWNPNAALRVCGV
mgnify:CR=1 FL=1|jgi:hypothetical protein